MFCVRPLAAFIIGRVTMVLLVAEELSFLGVHQKYK
jgi:hypothetical protein